MSVEIEEITEKALSLSPSARAHLAEILLESLDYEEDFAVSPEWMAEIRRRSREIDSGEVEMLDIAEDETAYLLRSPANRDRLLKAIENVARNRVP